MQTQFNDPWETVVTHSIGQGKKTIKNARGHMLYVEDFGTGDDNQPLNAKMAFCYDIAGNRTKRTDLNSGSLNCNNNSGENVSTWRYDAFGQLKEVHDPDMGVMTYGYNGFGDAIQKSDALNRTTTMIYDRLGRMTQKTLPGSEGVVTYTYDTLSGSDNALGQLVAIEDKAQRKTFSYDVLGRRKSETRQLKDIDTQALESPYTTHFRYDLLDRSTVIDYPVDPTSGTGVRVCYSYNSFGLVSGVDLNRDHSGSDCSSNQKTLVNDIQYNEFAQMASFTRGNGITTRFDYDNKRRIAKLHYDAGGTEYVEAVYSYNIQNSITNIQYHPTAAAAGSGWMSYASELEYQYDGLNRLIDARGHTTLAENGTGHTPQKFYRQYGYTLTGNLNRKDIRDFDSGNLQDRWAYSYQNHKVTSISTTAFGGNRFSMNYDAVGNTTGKTDQAPQQKPYQDQAPTGPLKKVVNYDSYNRITSVINAGSGEEVGRYFYDDQGFRVRKRSHQVVGGHDRYIELEYHNKYFALEKQTDITGQEVPNTLYSVKNVYLEGVRIAAVVPGGNARYFLTDQVDSVHVVTNDAGEAITRMEYLPYGETWFMEGEKNYAPKYNSQELDKESDLYFFNARHYDPEIARFVTADTVIDGVTKISGWNRYMYVAGNPINLKDPTGHHGYETGFIGTTATQANDYTIPEKAQVHVAEREGKFFVQLGRDPDLAINTATGADYPQGKLYGHNQDVEEGDARLSTGGVGMFLACENCESKDASVFLYKVTKSKVGINDNDKTPHVLSYVAYKVDPKTGEVQDRPIAGKSGSELIDPSYGGMLNSNKSNRDSILFKQMITNSSDDVSHDDRPWRKHDVLQQMFDTAYGDARDIESANRLPSLNEQDRQDLHKDLVEQRYIWP